MTRIRRESGADRGHFDPGAEDAANGCLAALRLPRDADTLDALFRARVGQAGAAPFLIANGRSASWDEIDGACRQWAAWMLDMGFRRGDRIAAALPNGDAPVILLLACARAGLVFAPLNPTLAAGEWSTILNVLRPAMLVVPDSEASRARDALSASGQDVPILELPAASLSLADASLDGRLPMRSAPVTVRSVRPPDPDEPLAIVFTSGTTGVPKGAVHSNRTYVTAAEIATWRMRLSPADTMLVILPLFHLNALFYSVGGAIASGARLVIEERFSAGAFWPTVRRHGVTQVNMIAAVGNILLKRDRSEFPGNDTLRKVSAAPVPAQVADQLREAFGITHVVESYGMTEAPGIAQVDFDDTAHRACLGRPIRHPLTGAPVSEIRIVDEGRRAVPSGETGRIMVRSTTMMKGYFNRADLEDAIDPDGWFLTEDLGRLDEDGYCWFHGRTAEMIRTRGQNVAASEVEAALLTHPAISDAACVGVPAELGEEDILAAVVPRPGAMVETDSVTSHCAALLAPYKRPRWLVVRSELPRTATEKVARHRLRQDPRLMDEARPC